MMTIKEKVEEYADEQDLRMAYNGSCDNCRQGFIVGANYVLDKIEEIVKYDKDPHCIEVLKERIWRLKQ